MIGNRIVAIIPARMDSSRFPGKPLTPILGRPMIEHVYRRTAATSALAAVYVATCDTEIRDAVETFDGMAIMTSDHHERASDRVAEAAQEIQADIIVMVQGDEPMVRPEMIDEAVTPLLNDSSVQVSNLRAPIYDAHEFANPDTIKVVVDRQGDALYMSRHPIPSSSHPAVEAGVLGEKQVCIIPFRRDFLFSYAKMPPTPLELAESIDMLRIMEHGGKIRVAPTRHSTHAVDRPEDVSKVEAFLRDDPFTTNVFGMAPWKETP